MVLVFLNIYPHFHDDVEIIMMSIKCNPSIIRYIPNKLKTNKEFIKKALSINILIFPYVRGMFAKDIVFVKCIIIKNITYLRCANNQIKNDRNFILYLIVRAHLYRLKFPFKYIVQRLRNDTEIAYEIVKISGNNIIHLSKKLKYNKKVQMNAFIYGKCSKSFIFHERNYGQNSIQLCLKIATYFK